MQRILSSAQTETFHHDLFVEDQIRHFIELAGEGGPKSVTDVGGGRGFFARRLSQVTGHRVRVVDRDEASVDACRNAGVEAARGDALDAAIAGPADVVTFNLILHHLVGSSERTTREMQGKALALWVPHASAVFVNEYIYESWITGFSARLIYEITKSRVLSWVGRAASVLAPTLRANTFGVGVRFRDHRDWLQLFDAAGFEIVATRLGAEEDISLPRRLLLIRKIRRDSFLLAPRTPALTK